MSDEKSKLKKLSQRVLALIIIISGACIYLTANLGFDYDFEQFFPQNDPDTEFFRYFRSHFETDNDFVLAGIENDEGIFKEDFLQRIDSLTAELQKVDSVTQVISPTNMEMIYRDPMFGQVFKKPLIRYDSESHLKSDSTNIFSSDKWLGTLVSTDGKSVILQIKHAQYLSKEKCDTLALDIQEKFALFDFDDFHLAGRSVGQQYYVNLMQTELVIFMGLSLILIIIFLIIAWRSSWGVWVPMTVVLLSAIWILGIMKLTGKDIDLMLTVLPTIIFVVGMSDVIHILSRYFEELRNGLEKIEAVKIAFKEIGLATLLTSITTAIGFLTLLTSSIIPIREFGIYTAIGVFVAFILAYSLLPAVLVLSKAPKTALAKKGVFWNRQMRRAFLWTINHRSFILVTSLLILIVSIIGLSKIEVNNFLLEDLKDDDFLKQEFMFFENNFAGSRPFEMGLIVNSEEEILSLEMLQKIDSIDDYLKNHYGVGTIISPARIIKEAHQTYKGGKVKYYKLPESESDLKKITSMFSKYDKQDVMGLFVNEEENLVRITGKVGDWGAQEFFKLNDELEKFMSSNFDPDQLSYRITGTATLIDNNNSYLAKDMLYGLLIAFLVVGCIVGIMFKNIKMTLVSLIPNMLPLIGIAGIMGYAGIDLKVSTSIIFTIAFGIAVDDTIHFMSKLRLQLAKGRTLVYALKRTYISTGKAIIVTSIILCGGFLTLILSDFLGTFYIGLLISLTLLFAVISDLFLLPILVLWVFGGKKIEVQGKGFKFLKKSD